MKDDDSSSIVRSQTAHRVDVSEYTGNATTPQNHVTSDVDRVLTISDADAGPARRIDTPDEHSVDDATGAHLNTQALPEDPVTPHHRTSIEAEARLPASDPATAPVDQFQDELAAIERARSAENRVAAGESNSLADHRVSVPAPDLTASVDQHLGEPPHETAVHVEPSTETSLSTHAADASAQAEEHFVAEPNEAARAESHSSLHAPIEDLHIEAAPLDAAPQAQDLGEAKPVFTDHLARLPEADLHAPHEADLGGVELDHPHPLVETEPEHDQAHDRSPLHVPGHLAPPHALSPTGAAMAELNKDEFQGRLAGIKREVQALNDRLTDFEAELDKDGMRPARR